MKLNSQHRPMASHILETSMHENQTIDDRRLTLERDFHNERFAQEVRQPTHGFYRAVHAAFECYEQRLQQLIPGKAVLEYGCGTGSNAMRLAQSAAHITGIDLSDVAIAQARQVAERYHKTNMTFETMNAEKMTFPDQSFDVVFGSSILHHLELHSAYASISRVLRPGGSALFLEPLGHNPLINAYRRRTPAFRTPDEHPLLKSDIQLSRNYFANSEVELFGLSTLMVIPFLTFPWATTGLAVGQSLDRLLLRIPGLRWGAWFSVLEFRK